MIAVLNGDQYRDRDKRDDRIVIVIDSPDRLGETQEPNPFIKIRTIKSRNPNSLGHRSSIRRQTLMSRFTYLPKGSPSYVKTGERQ